MSTPILATKLYIPLTRSKIVRRPRLIEPLTAGLAHKLILISAPAGFGKSTLVSEWVDHLRLTRDDHRLGGAQGSQIAHPQIAWLSLDEGDSDPNRFLTYLVAALQTLALSEVEGVSVNIGKGMLEILQSPQPPPAETILTALLNEIATLQGNFVLVLDDYHVVDATSVDNALTFLLQHLPPQMHLVIATREDPQLPLARLRSRGQLTELRAKDLRFTSAEAAEFLNRVMGLSLAADDIAALEARTEGWIAGLQLAALSMQGQQDVTRFIQSFTGSHHFVLDYLLEEVLVQQAESTQTFLLRTSILDRLCGPLCDAVLLDSSASGQETLEYLERANLFIVPLDSERRWYRYHRLFGDLLRQRLQQSAAASTGDGVADVAALHIRASQWFEENGLEIEAFHHAAAAHDIDRAARLAEGKGMPLLFRGAVALVLNWLASLPTTELDHRPALWVMYASAFLFVSQLAGIEAKLQAAEAAIQSAEIDVKIRDLIGHIASIRATVAVTQHQVDTIVAQSRRALEYLHPDNLPVRTATTWTLGYAYHLRGDRDAARQAYTEAIATSQAIGHFIITIMATLGLGNLQEVDNQLELAAETYRRVLQLAGDPPLPVACEAHLGLARLYYEWNDLDAAQQHAQQSAQLARQLANTDRFIACELFLARLKLTQGDVASATAILAKAEQAARQQGFVARLPEVAVAQVLTLLQQGKLADAAQLAQEHALSISQARIHLAQGDAAAALATLEPLRQQAEVRGWADERLRLMVLQALALHAQGEKGHALHLLGDALMLAAPGGFIRLFVDEGTPMARLLSAAATRGLMPGYVDKLLAAFETKAQRHKDKSEPTPVSPAQSLVEPLSARELEVLQLIALGLSNHEIGERLFLALDTVKGHNRRIFDKLQVERRTEAVAKARSLHILPRND